MGGKIDFGRLLSVNQSVVRMTEREGGLSEPVASALRVRLDAASVGAGSRPSPDEETRRNSDTTAILTVENAKRFRAMKGGVLPARWRKAGLRMLHYMKCL